MSKSTSLVEVKAREKMLEYAHWHIPDIEKYINVKSPTYEGFFRGEETLPSVLLETLQNPDYFYFLCRHILNIELLPVQAVILKELWLRPFPLLIASRGFGKSFMLALYCIIRMMLCPGAKIVVVGAAFRQAKVIFEYMESIFLNAPLLRQMCCPQSDKTQGPRRDIDRCILKLGNSFTVALPLGDGQKIRGMRAHYIIADEAASIAEAVYENVVAGFAAVSAHPVDNVKLLARRKLRQEMGIWSEQSEKAFQNREGNQAVLSGTAYYHFNHFAKYWNRYRNIVLSKGDKKKLQEIFNGEVPENFNWRDYSVIRIPYELIPPGFMDDKHVARSKATVHSGIYQMEFGACFATDSNGFFRRSIIESCVCKEDWVINFPSCGTVNFRATLRGNSRATYVMAIDPAAEHDNFSIVILEIWPEHRRIVFCWTTTRQQHRERVKANFTTQQDFYGFCARKIRDLLKVFPCSRIAIDSQGGGLAVEEALHDPDKMVEGELPLWPIPDPKKERVSDVMAGEHILEMINFASEDWVIQANHGMKKDFEDKVLLFPFFDTILISEAMEEDKATQRMYDTLEDCVMEIEELKDELATIVHSQTINGRDRWDTPEVKLPGGKKGRQRKDRYSALLMANMVARQMARAIAPPTFEVMGGFANQLSDTEISKNHPLFIGPEWYVKGAQELWG